MASHQARRLAGRVPTTGTAGAHRTATLIVAGAHPSAYTFSLYGPSALAWLPAQWVSDGRPGRRRTFGAARHLAVVADERARTAGLAHQTALAANLQADAESDLIGPSDVTEAGGPVIALQLTKNDLEALGLVRLDISPSAAMASVSTLSSGAEPNPDPATETAAWRLLEAGDTLCISQVESIGFRMLLKRARELAALQSQHGQALRSIEDLAQLLALWKHGCRKDSKHPHVGPSTCRVA